MLVHPVESPVGGEVFVEIESLKIVAKCCSPIYTDPAPLKGVLVYGFTLFLILFGVFPSNCSHLGGMIGYD